MRIWISVDVRLLLCLTISFTAGDAEHRGRVEVANNGCERALRPTMVRRTVTNGYQAMWAAAGEADVRTVVGTPGSRGRHLRQPHQDHRRPIASRAALPHHRQGEPAHAQRRTCSVITWSASSLSNHLPNTSYVKCMM